MTKKVSRMLTRSAADINDLARTMPARAHLELGALTSAVPTARRWARVILSGWNLPHLADDGGPILSELVTNSVLHGSGPKVGIWLGSDRERLVIMVGDPSPDMPVRAETPDDDRPSGRGLVIVDALAERWGAYRVPTGKITWAMLACEPVAPSLDETHSGALRSHPTGRKLAAEQAAELGGRR